MFQCEREEVHLMKNKNGIKAHNNQEVGVDPAHQAIDNLVAIVTDLKAFKEIV